MLCGEVDRQIQANEGTRNHELNRSAFALGQPVATGHLDQAQVRDDLTAAALSIRLPARHDWLSPRSVQGRNPGG